MRTIYAINHVDQSAFTYKEARSPFPSSLDAKTAYTPHLEQRTQRSTDSADILKHSAFFAVNAVLLYLKLSALQAVSLS